MLQSGGLISEISVRELVQLAASLYPAPMAVDEVLARADLAGLAGRRTTKLSGGQSQRVRFALALVPDPELLVLDEPTAAMDVESRRRFWASMRELTAAGRTVLFATHYLEEADQYADRVVLHGRRPGRRRRARDRDQGRRRRPYGPGHPARLPARPCCGGCPASARSSCTGTRFG